MATRPLETQENTRPEAANDATPPKRWHPSGPPGQESVDAASHYLHSMWSATECAPGTIDFTSVAVECHRNRSRSAHQRISDAFLADGRNAAVAAVETRTYRRMMDPVIEHDFIRLVPDLFVAPFALDEIDTRSEVLVVRRERCSFSRKRSDVRSAPGHLAISRHALERMHERSLQDGGDLADTIRREIGDADRALEFAWTAGIHLGASPTDRLAATAIPFLDGLLLVQNRIIAMRQDSNPAEWQEMRPSGIHRHAIPINPLTTVPTPDLWGRRMVGHVVSVAATYVAGDMMRNAQGGYRDWFLRTMSRHEHEMPGPSERATRCIEHHRVVGSERKTICVPDLGRRVLHEIVNQRPRQPTLMSIGWTRFAHPARW